MIIYNLDGEPVPQAVPHNCIHVYPEKDCAEILHVEHWDGECGEWVEDDAVRGYTEAEKLAQELEQQYRVSPQERLALKLERLAAERCTPDFAKGLCQLAQEVREL